MKEGPFTTRAPLSLEERFDLLLRENAVLRSQLLWLEHRNGRVFKEEEQHAWLTRKIERQRLAIQRLEWKGWQPELIIEESA